jgi:hypothetical protein
MIDLKPFCCTEPTRYYLNQPWSVDKFTYASNGHVLVRVARRDDVPENDAAPKVAQFWESFDDKANFVSPPQTPKFSTKRCDHCKGSGAVILCEECEGDGVVECDLGHDHDCEECDGNGVIYAREIGEEGAICCDTCDGKGRIPDLDQGYSAGVLLPDGVSVTLKYLVLLNSLPNVRWLTNADQDQVPIHFVFDGGAGLLMKRRPGFEALRIADEGKAA